ncbi:MAG TPA: GDP-mannose 4,6-dehydratase [Terriglobales bacterium]|nr:GDP-mannose 4,6-dehydratase [Terriglobales bacterium]
MTVVVIGSNSFSGSDFIDLLLGETDHRVVGISRSPEKGPLFLPYLHNAERQRFQFVALDLNRDIESICELIGALQPQYVVNFASQSEVAPSWDHPEQWAQTNVVSTAALGNFLSRCAWLVRYLHISTPEVYGSCAGAVREDHRFDPSTPYAASRAGAELMLRTLIRGRGLRCVVVRSANVYGAHQQLHKIVPRTAIHLKLQRPLELHGGGWARRSFIHVRDVSRGELAILQRGEVGTAYHLATEDTVTIRDLVRRICELAGAEFDAHVVVAEDRPGQDNAYLLDCTRAHALGWRAEVPLDAGLAEVLSWVEQEWSQIEHQPLEYRHRP